MNEPTLMQKSVATVRSEVHLHRAASLLRDRDCGSVVVIDGSRHPVGMLTDRDVCLAA